MEPFLLAYVDDVDMSSLSDVKVPFSRCLTFVVFLGEMAGVGLSIL
jgi:hypothetical protein